MKIEDFKHAAGPNGQDVWNVLLPFMPALARDVPAVTNLFLEYLDNTDWEAIDSLMYEKMTPAERLQLENQVYLDAVDAVQSYSDTIASIKQIALQMLVQLAIIAIRSQVPVA